MGFNDSQRKGEAALFLLNFIGASTFLFTKEFLHEVEPFCFVAIRFAVAALAAALFFPRTLLAVRQTPGALLNGLLVGAFFGGGVLGLSAGLKHVPSGQAAFVVCFDVLLVPFIDFFLFRGRASAKVLFGIFFAYIGLALLTFDSEGRISTGDLLVLSGSVSFAFYIILNGRFSARYGAMQIGVLQLFGAAIVAAVAALLFGTLSVPTSGSFWRSMLFLAVIATTLRLPLASWAQAQTTPARAGLVYAFEPVIAAWYGWIIAGEMLTLRQLLGCAVILAAVVSVQVPWRLRIRRRVALPD